MELNETDSPVTLSCDNFKVINTTDRVVGNYSYYLDDMLLTNQLTSYYTLEFNFTYNGRRICCYIQNKDACGICYHLTVFCKCLYLHIFTLYLNL